MSIINHYKLDDKPIGEGRFGVVYLGMHRMTFGQFAVKVIRIDKTDTAVRKEHRSYLTRTSSPSRTSR